MRLYHIGYMGKYIVMAMAIQAAMKLPISIFENIRKCIQCNTHFNTHSQPHEHALYESSQFCSRNIQLFRLRMIIS